MISRLPDARYLKDLVVGERIHTGDTVLTCEQIQRFAREYDPQPMHLEEGAADATAFGGLIANGWQTLAVTMRLMADAKPLGATPMVGVEVREAKFARPVRPGDRLSAEAKLLEIQRSRSRPDRGSALVRVVTCNQTGAEVLTRLWVLVVPARPAGDPTVSN